MWRNACNFNEPGSQIYNDAKALKKLVSSKRVEIEQSRFTGHGKTSERIRNRKMKSGLAHSALVAALQYEDLSEEEEMDEDELHEEDEDEALEEEEEDEESKCGDSENPLWALYDAVCSYRGTSGKLISDPFRRLPSRRYYPDYYREIKYPISLAQIKMKIKVIFSYFEAFYILVVIFAG